MAAPIVAAAAKLAAPVLKDIAVTAATTAATQAIASGLSRCTSSEQAAEAKANVPDARHPEQSTGHSR